MRRLIFVFAVLLSLSPSILLAQNGSITGTLLDRETSEPVTGGIVRVFTPGSDSSLVSGAETEAGGTFTISDLPPGTYRLTATYIGYNTVTIRGVPVRAGETTSVDTILLRSGITTTEEIEVESETPPVQILPDKKVFNVEQSMVTRGSSVTDLLANLPGITVDSEGNVSLRGTENVRILIDGRPSGLDGPNRANILQQLSADDIERVELVTNPSAKYEAEGVSGIINIIMKKNTGFGYNGSLSLNAGTNDKYNGSLNFNMRNNKVNIFGDYSYRMFNGDLDGSSTRQSTFEGTTSYLDQITDGFMRFGGHNVRMGLDYFINENHTLGLSGRFNDRLRKRSSTDENIFKDANQTITEQFLRDINSEDDSQGLELELNYTAKLKNPGQTFKGEISYERETEEDVTLSDKTILFPANSSPESIRETGNETSSNINVQLDYEHPITKEIKLEAGLRSNIRNQDDDFLSELYDFNQNIYVADTNLSRRFIYDQGVHSAYATFTQQLGNFGYQLGLRGEYTMTDGEVSNTSQTFDNNYFSLFPSVSLSQKLSETDELQATYSRRIQRPRSRFLNPFRNQSDPLNIQEGNPNLRPEYTDSYELSYVKYLNTVTITPSIFYRRSTDEITRVRTLIDSNTTLTTFDNLQSSQAYGGELLVNANLFKMWNTNASVSYYRNDIEGGSIVGTDNSTYTWNGRVASTLRLPDLFEFQLMYRYSGERITPQAIIDPFHAVDVALSKNFFDDKATLGLRVSDLFNSAQMNIRFRDANFIETSDRRRDTRTFFATFTYRIGDMGRSRNNTRRRPNNEEQAPADEEFDF